MALVNLIHWTSLKMICCKLQENTSPIFCCTIISIFLPSFSDQFWPTPSIEIALFLPVYYFAFFSRIFKEYLMCVWERKRERWYCCISLVVFLCVIKCIMGGKYVWPQVFLLTVIVTICTMIGCSAKTNLCEIGTKMNWKSIVISDLWFQTFKMAKMPPKYLYDFCYLETCWT